MVHRPTDECAGATEGLNPTIHQPARLRIVAALAALQPRESVNFTHLKRELGLTDGNLGAHLTTLEGAGYLRVSRTQKGLRSTTFVALSPAGRQAFEAYRTTLMSLLGR